MKFRVTVTVDLDDAHHYDMDENGWVIGEPILPVTHKDVAEYAAAAVSAWGGQMAPADPFFPRNIRSVRVQGGHGDNKVDITV